MSLKSVAEKDSDSQEENLNTILKYEMIEYG